MEGERVVEGRGRNGESPHMYRDGGSARHPLAADSVAGFRDKARQTGWDGEQRRKPACRTELR